MSEQVSGLEFTVVPDISWRKQDWAYEQMREWIITAQIPPGERIDQEQIAAAMGISRIPLREALARLISEGLLGGQPHRRLVVTELSLPDARDVYLGRRALERALAAEAAAHAKDSDLSAIRASLDTQRQMLAKAGTDDFRDLDRRFHLAIYALAAMPKTLGTATSLYSMSERYVRLYLDDPARSAASFHEHEAIFAAIESGDSEAAGRLTAEHVSGGLRLLEAHYADSEIQAH